MAKSVAIIIQDSKHIAIPILPGIHAPFIQGHSHQYSWSGFNRTTFQGNNPLSANIHKFGGVLSRLVGSHVATVDRARD